VKEIFAIEYGDNLLDNKGTTDNYRLTETYKYFLESPEPSVKHTSYFAVYDYLFSRFNDKEIVFVEVGVLNGGSLFMWRRYFGKNAKIIGIDLNPNAKKWESQGFEIYIGNQGDPNFWTNTLKQIGKIDILLDDGGHTYKQQVITVESVVNSINENGLIVIEDVQTSYLKGFGPRRYSFIKYTKSIIDKINLRSGELASLTKQQTKKTKIWSVQTFESIVAFHINDGAVNTVSSRIQNHSESAKTIDYRYLDNRIFKSGSIFTDKYLRKFRIVKYPGMKILKFISYLDALKSRYFKYF
jgi:hypothetical protein